MRSDHLLRSALRRFGLKPDRPPESLESRSGAGVHPVRTSGGDAAYLKLTPPELGPEALAAARRELRFYRHLSARAPVRTPRLLDAADDGDGVVLLLTATGTPVPAGSWTTDMWAALGRDLAALHEMADPGWTRPDELRAALAAPGRAAAEEFWGATLPRLAEPGELAEAMDALPPVFVHGDCHTGNIAVHGGALALLDWQMCGTGRPGADLAFLNVRAATDGVAAPAELTTAYLSHRDVDRLVLQRATLAEELAVYLFQWPPFAAYHTPAAVALVRRRAAQLTERWLDEG